MPSSVIHKFTYDTSSSILRIVFVSGNIYEYRDVPLEVYQSMKRAPSKGTYFNQKVKGKYFFEKIE